MRRYVTVSLYLFKFAIKHICLYIFDNNPCKAHHVRT